MSLRRRHFIRAVLGIILGVWTQAAFAAMAKDPAAKTTPARAAQTDTTVLVAGATGQTGRFVVEQLQTKGYAIRAMTRSRARAVESFGESDAWVEADATNVESLRTALDGIDKIICTIGATAATGPNSPEFVDYGGVKNLVDAALEQGVSHFVLVSSVGATQEDHFLNKVFGDVLKWKFKGEEYLRQSGLSYTIVRPGGLQNMPGGVMNIRFYQGDDPSVQGLITRADVAAITVEALTNADAVNKTFEVINAVEERNPAWADELKNLDADGERAETPDQAAPSDDTSGALID